MSFLFGGGGRPQLSSAQKIEAAETELELVSDMFNRYGVYQSHLAYQPLMLDEQAIAILLEEVHTSRLQRARSQ